MSPISDLERNDVVLIIVKKEDYAASVAEITKAFSKLVKKACYVCLNSPYTHVAKRIEKAGLGQERFFFIDVLTRNVQEPARSDNCIFVSAPNAFTELSLAFSTALNEKKCDGAIIDAISSLLVYQGANKIIQLTHEFITKIRVVSGKAALIALKDDVDSELVKDLYMFVDKVVDLGKA